MERRRKMNPAFIILVILGAIALWFLLSFLFVPLGKLISKIWNDTMHETKKDDTNRKEKQEP